MKTELTEVKAALAEVKVLNANRHEALMSILSSSWPNSLLLNPESAQPPDSFPVLSSLFFHLFSTTVSHYLVVLCD